jgi:hypothetical protein
VSENLALHLSANDESMVEIYAHFPGPQDVNRSLEENKGL